MPATWYFLTHGTSGLVLAYALTFFALVITLFQQHAPARLILLSPLLALPCALAGALAAAAVASATPAPATPGGQWVSLAVSAAVLAFAGLAGGLIFTRQRAQADTHKRGDLTP